MKSVLMGRNLILALVWFITCIPSFGFAGAVPTPNNNQPNQDSGKQHSVASSFSRSIQKRFQVKKNKEKYTKILNQKKLKHKTKRLAGGTSVSGILSLGFSMLCLLFIIISLVVNVYLAFVLLLFAFGFAITAFVTGIISFSKDGSKAMGIVGFILSIIEMLVTIILMILAIALF